MVFALRWFCSCKELYYILNWPRLPRRASGRFFTSRLRDSIVVVVSSDGEPCSCVHVFMDCIHVIVKFLDIDSVSFTMFFCVWYIWSRRRGGEVSNCFNPSFSFLFVDGVRRWKEFLSTFLCPMSLSTSLTCSPFNALKFWLWWTC